MKNILLLGLLSTILFVGCSSKTIEIIEEKQEQQREVKIELSAEDINAQKELEEEKKKEELKKKLDSEALTNSDKKLNADEIDGYVIDESTPLILKNQSEERAYE
jgi:predicted component of type VI protein secretion system